MNNIKVKHPNNLKELREKAGLTQKELSLLLEFDDSQGRICKWEKGIAIPSLSNLFKLARFYKVKIEEMYPGM